MFAVFHAMVLDTKDPDDSPEMQAIWDAAYESSETYWTKSFENALARAEEQLLAMEEGK